jgi:hypothetical protein
VGGRYRRRDTGLQPGDISGKQAPTSTLGALFRRLVGLGWFGREELALSLAEAASIGQTTDCSYICWFDPNDSKYQNYRKSALSERRRGFSNQRQAGIATTK